MSRPDCPTCHGAGWVERRRAAWGRPAMFAAYPCPDCAGGPVDCPTCHGEGCLESVATYIDPSGRFVARELVEECPTCQGCGTVDAAGLA